MWRAGIRGSVRNLLYERQRPLLLRAVRRANKSAGADAAIFGVVKNDELRLVYIDNEHGVLLDETTELAFEPLAELLAPVLQPSSLPKGDDDDDDSSNGAGNGGPSPAEDLARNQPGSELLSLQLGFEFGGRFFAYSESEKNRGNMLPYEVFGVPAIMVAGALYPAATASIPWLRNLGLTASYSHAFGLSSEAGTGERFATSWEHLKVGLRYRFRVGSGTKRPIVLGLNGQFVLLDFLFEAEDKAAHTILNRVSDVQYRALRFGLDANLPLGTVFSLRPRVGYLGALEAGPIYDRFTDVSMGAIDFGLTLAFALGLGFESRVGFDYTRMFSAFDPKPTDAFIAGGAVDQYVVLQLAAAYLY